MLVQVLTYLHVTLFFTSQKVNKKTGTKLTHVLRLRPFILNDLSYIYKEFPNHIKKKFHKNSQLKLSNSVTIFIHVSWQLLTQHCQDGRELEKFILYITRTSIPPYPIYYPPTFGWTWCHTSTIKFVFWITKVISIPNHWRIF